MSVSINNDKNRLKKFKTASFFILFGNEGLQAFDGFGCGYAAAAVVEVDEHIAVVAHAELFHVGELAQAVAALDAFDHVVVFGFGHGVDEVYAGLIEGEDVGRRENADVGGYDRSGVDSLTVARHRHVAHYVDVGDIFSEMVDDRFCRLGHALHEFLFFDVPLVVLTGSCVDPGLAYAAVGASDSDILVASAETALSVALEVGQNDQRVVVGKMSADRHLLKPFSSFDGEHRSAVFIEDVDGAESPAVDFERLAMLRGSVAVAVVVGVCLDDSGFGQIFRNQSPDPVVGDYVGAVLLAGVELHGCSAFDIASDLFESFYQTLGAELAGEINYRFVAGALFVRHILVSVFSRNGL